MAKYDIRAQAEMRAGRFNAALSLLRGIETRGGQEKISGEAALHAEALLLTGHDGEAITLATAGVKDPLTEASSDVRFLRVLALASFDQGDIAKSLEFFRKAQRVARRTHDLEQLCDVQLDCLSHFSDLGIPAALPTTLIECEKNVRMLGHPHRKVRLHLAIGQIEGKRGMLKESVIHCKAAEKLLRASPNLWLEGLLRLNHSMAHALVGDISTSLRFAEEALRCAESSGHHRTRIGAIGNLAYLYLWNYELDKAIEQCERGLALASRHPELKRALLDTLAQTTLARRQPDRCRQLIRRIEDEGDGETGRPSTWRDIATALTKVRLLGQYALWEEAFETARAAIRQADEREDRFHGISLRVLGSDALIELDRFDEAGTLLGEAEELLEDVPLSIFAEVERGRAAMVAATVGRDTARRQFERALRLLSNVGGTACRMDAATSYQRTMQPTNIALARRLETDTWRLESVTKSTLPGAAGHTLEEGGRRTRMRGVSLPDTMVLTRLVQHPYLLAQEAFILLRESGHVAGIASVQREPGQAARVVAQEGWTPETARSQAAQRKRSLSIPIGSADGRDLELLAEPAGDVQSEAFVRGFRAFLRRARSLQAFQETERKQLPLLSFESTHADEGVFVSESMRQLVSTAKQVATSDVPILITGDTGTGKEVLARLIHKYSHRADRDFVPFNCTGVPKDMIEGQLFGHRRGAFTGAREDSPGVIRAASGGTLLLDEIGEVEPHVQPKLLRFLDKREVHPIGEPRPIAVDVRVIAATNADLDHLVREGLFREDLLYRLNIITLDVPPLKTRREEILPLVYHFLHQIGRDSDRPNLDITEDAEKCLLCFEWPGNVRRLGNEMRRAVALARGNTIGLEHLSPEVIEAGRAIGETAQSAIMAASPTIPIKADQSLADAVAHLEHVMISRTLEKVGGHMGRASRKLGLSRKGLYLKRQRLGLDAV